MNINFKNFEVQTSFEGKRQVFNISEALGNEMMYNGVVLLDIGFEDLARDIYYSEGEIDIPQKYRDAIIQVVKGSNFIAAIKRELILRLSIKQ